MRQCCQSLFFRLPVLALSVNLKRKFPGGTEHLPISETFWTILSDYCNDILEPLPWRLDLDHPRKEMFKEFSGIIQNKARETHEHHWACSLAHFCPICLLTCHGINIRCALKCSKNKCLSGVLRRSVLFQYCCRKSVRCCPNSMALPGKVASSFILSLHYSAQWLWVLEENEFVDAQPRTFMSFPPSLPLLFRILFRHPLMTWLQQDAAISMWVMQWIACRWELYCSAFFVPCWFQMIPLLNSFQSSRWCFPGAQWLRHLKLVIPTKNL